MTTKTILLFLTFFFTACVERGYTPKPINHSIAKPIKTHKVKPSISKPQKILKNEPTLPIIQIKQESTPVQKKEISTQKMTTPISNQILKEEKNDFFSLTEETKNKISGFFILIIGIIILL